MSTYYYFGCKKCHLYGGFFSQQMWGWGNADIIDSFQFIMKHVNECNPSNIYILSEESDEIDEYKKDKSENLLEYYPRSDDWKKGEHKIKFEKHRKYIEKLEQQWKIKMNRYILFLLVFFWTLCPCKAEKITIGKIVAYESSDNGIEFIAGNGTFITQLKGYSINPNLKEAAIKHLMQGDVVIIYLNEKGYVDKIERTNPQIGRNIRIVN